MFLSAGPPGCHEGVGNVSRNVVVMKGFLRQGTPSISVFSAEGVVPDVLGVEGGSCLGSGSMGVCKDAGEEMGTMVGWAITGQ